MSISQLLYPRVNLIRLFPQWGAVSGVLLLPFARLCGGDSALTRTSGAGGGPCFAGRRDLRDLASMITSHPLQGHATVPGLHEVLGRASGIGLGVGILLFEYYALRQRRGAENDSVSRQLVIWWSFITWLAVILVILRLVSLRPIFGPPVFHTGLKRLHSLASGILGMDRGVAVIAFLIVSAWLCRGSGLERPAAPDRTVLAHWSPHPDPCSWSSCPRAMIIIGPLMSAVGVVARGYPALPATRWCARQPSSGNRQVVALHRAGPR